MSAHRAKPSEYAPKYVRCEVCGVSRPQTTLDATGKCKDVEVCSKLRAAVLKMEPGAK